MVLLSAVRPLCFFDCLSCATDALYAEDLILLPRQFVVVHKKLFELLDELLAEIANDFDISRAMIVGVAALLSLNNSHNPPLSTQPVKAGSSMSTSTSNNSVVDGIHPMPNQFTAGEGPVPGQEVEFNVIFTTRIDLLPDHYFFRPKVLFSSGGDFPWPSAPRPIVPPGTPYPTGFTDLRSWTRNDNLAPGLVSNRQRHHRAGAL